MSTSYNRVMLIGRLGKNADKKIIGEATKLSFSIATDSYRGKDNDSGESIYVTQWHFCSLFGKLADAIGKYMTKGKLVHVEGELNYWQDDDSNWHTEIKAHDVKLLSLKGDEENNFEEAEVDDSQNAPSTNKKVPAQQNQKKQQQSKKK